MVLVPRLYQWYGRLVPPGSTAFLFCTRVQTVSFHLVVLVGARVHDIFNTSTVVYRYSTWYQVPTKYEIRTWYKNYCNGTGSDLPVLVQSVPVVCERARCGRADLARSPACVFSERG